MLLVRMSCCAELSSEKHRNMKLQITLLHDAFHLMHKQFICGFCSVYNHFQNIVVCTLWIFLQWNTFSLFFFVPPSFGLWCPLLYIQASGDPTHTASTKNMNLHSMKNAYTHWHNNIARLAIIVSVHFYCH